MGNKHDTRPAAGIQKAKTPPAGAGGVWWIKLTQTNLEGEVGADAAPEGVDRRGHRVID